MSAPQAPDPDEAVLVVFNPAAGGRRAIRFRNAIRQRLDDAPVTVHWVETEHSGHGEALVRQWRSAVNRVIAIGGDGTVHEVVNGLFDLEGFNLDPGPVSVAVGVVHTGTGGDFR
ncbi:MAG: acylglycerol kinase family protein, partial [Myxococcota bacterium]